MGAAKLGRWEEEKARSSGAINHRSTVNFDSMRVSPARK